MLSWEFAVLYVMSSLVCGGDLSFLIPWPPTSPCPHLLYVVMFWFSIPAWSTIPECSGWKHNSVYFSTGFQFWPCVPGLAFLCPRWYCVSFMWLACWYWVLDGKGPQFSLYWAFLQGCLGLLTACGWLHGGWRDTCQSFQRQGLAQTCLALAMFCGLTLSQAQARLKGVEK